MYPFVWRILLLITVSLFVFSPANAANGMAPKEITPGCLANPLPSMPSGPSVSVEVQRGAGERFRLVIWRRPCSGNDGQLILTFTPLAGSPQICANDMEITQGGVRSDDFYLSTDAGGSAAQTLCGPISTTTSALIREIDGNFTFDDDLAFVFTYEQTSPTPDVMVNVAAYDPSLYPAGGQIRSPSGNLSGSYYDAARPGEGLFIEIGQVGDRRVLFVSWYTYFQGMQRWIIGNVDFPAGATSVTVPLQITAGTGFGTQFNPANVQYIPWGSATFRFLSCTELSFDWASNEGESGTYSYVRLVNGLLGVSCQ
ncbi:MAG: hypothetical protein KDI71_14415 [Xanthomonadales bacterium]|nr:hypothetical protein [Xanthomonadales bacterium]